MKAKWKCSMALLLSFAMMLTMIPVQAAKVSATNAEEGQGDEIMLSNGIYQVPIKECQIPGTSFWQENWATYECWQADQYITVEAEDGMYTISLSLYGGSEMDAVQVAKSGIYTEASDFKKAVLDSDLLEGKVSEDDLAALESAQVSASGSEAGETKFYDTVKKTGNHGMADFSYTTDKLEESIRYLALSPLYSNNTYTKDSVSRVSLKPDWEAALKLSMDSDKYSVLVMNTGTDSNGFDSDREMDLKVAALFERAVVVEKKGDSLQAGITLSGVQGNGYIIESLSRISETNELSSKNFKSLGTTTVTEELKLEQGSFTVSFVGLFTSVGIDIKISGQKNIIHTRLRLVKGLPEKQTVADGKVSVESFDGKLKNSSLKAVEYTQANAPSYAGDDYVRNIISIARKGEYRIYETNLKESTGKDTGAVKNVTAGFQIPDNWNPENVQVYRIVEIDMQICITHQAQAVACYAKEGMAYANVSEYTNDIYLVFERVQTENIKKLEDGIYDVTATLWNAATSSEAQSMAATVVKPEAVLMIQGKKKYLRITFDEAGILFMPAYLSKAYANDVDTTRNDEVTKQYQTGSVLEFWDEERVREFSKNLLKTYRGLSEEEAEELVAQEMLQNNLKYVKTITLDISNSIIKEGLHKDKIAIAFCCDIMDTLYNGIQGSDAGFNDAVLMLSDPSLNDKLKTEDVLGVVSVTDKSELKVLFEKAFKVSRSRTRYTKDSYNAFVPTWSQTYAVYNSVASTQKEVDAAVQAMTVALDNLVSLKELNDVLVKVNIISSKNCEETSYVNLTNAKTEANNVYKNSAATQEEVDEQVRLLTEAREAVIPSETYLETVRTAAENAAAIEQTTEKGVYTNKSYDALQKAAAKASAVVAVEDVKYVAVEEAYKALTDAQKALGIKGELTALEEVVNKALERDLSKYLNSTVTPVEEAISAAQALIEEDDASQQEIEKTIEDLQTALDGLKVLEDGTYIVPINLWKSNENSESMGNAALVQKAKVVVRDGEAVVYFSFTKMKYAGKEGYLSDLSVLSNITFNENNLPSVYDKTSAEAVSVYDVVDEYNRDDSSDKNCAGKKYPKQMKLPVNLEENLIWAEVYVPVMGSVGSGTQLCRLRIDYSSAQEYVKPDMTELEKAIEKAEAVKAGEYTESSVQKLQEVLAAAGEVLESGYSLQSEVDDAVKKLDAAYQALEKKQEQPKDTETPGSTSLPEQPTVPTTALGSSDVSGGNPAETQQKAANKKKKTIKLAKKKLVIKKGKKAQIKIKSKPAGKVKYQSANKKIAKVSSKGKITAKKKGKTKITVSCSGVKAVVKVTVK